MKTYGFAYKNDTQKIEKTFSCENNKAAIALSYDALFLPIELNSYENLICEVSDEDGDIIDIVHVIPSH